MDVLQNSDIKCRNNSSKIWHDIQQNRTTIRGAQRKGIHLPTMIHITI